MTEQQKRTIFNIDEIPCQEISDPAVLSKTPLVSVKMITYNHEAYIAEAIEGVLIQETDFPIELVIGEDCSTDGTREIVFDYQKKHPDIIRVITSDHNVGMHENSIRTTKACRGKYIALCEGDDYWHHPQKLQKQVDFLEANADCSAVIHTAEHFDEDKPEKNFVQRPRKIPPSQRFTTKDVILDVAGNFATAALMLRRKYLKDLPEFFFKSPVGDFPLMLILAVKGNIGFIDEPMCVYRVTTGSSWTMSMRLDREKRRKHYAGIMRVYNEFDSWTENKYWFHVWLSKTKFSTKTNWAELRSFIKRSVLGLGKM